MYIQYVHGEWYSLDNCNIVVKIPYYSVVKIPHYSVVKYPIDPIWQGMHHRSALKPRL